MLHMSSVETPVCFISVTCMYTPYNGSLWRLVFVFYFVFSLQFFVFLFIIFATLLAIGIYVYVKVDVSTCVVLLPKPQHIYTHIPVGP